MAHKAAVMMEPRRNAGAANCFGRPNAWTTKGLVPKKIQPNRQRQTPIPAVPPSSKGDEWLNVTSGDDTVLIDPPEDRSSMAGCRGASHAFTTE
jgi:hypothetical protein